MNVLLFIMFERFKGLNHSISSLRVSSFISKNDLSSRTFAHGFKGLLLQNLEQKVQSFKRRNACFFGHLGNTVSPSFSDIVSHFWDTLTSQRFLLSICFGQKNCLNFCCLSVILCSLFSTLWSIYLIHWFHNILRRSYISNLCTFYCKTSIFHHWTYTV